MKEIIPMSVDQFLEWLKKENIQFALRQPNGSLALISDEMVRSGYMEYWGLGPEHLPSNFQWD